MNADQLMHNEILEHLENQCITKTSLPKSFSILETLEAFYFMIKFSNVGKLSGYVGKLFLGLFLGSIVFVVLFCFGFLIISVMIGYGILRCVRQVHQKREKLKLSKFVKSGNRGILG